MTVCGQCRQPAPEPIDGLERLTADRVVDDASWCIVVRVKLDADGARARLTSHNHGVLATMHPGRGPDPQPVVYAVSGNGHVGVPIDKVKPKSSSRLQREDNLAADLRATLLIEHWDAADWSRLWWVRAELRYEPDPPAGLTDELADLLAVSVPQYADKPFHRILVCRIVDVTGWSAAE